MLFTNTGKNVKFINHRDVGDKFGTGFGISPEWLRIFFATGPQNSGRIVTLTTLLRGLCTLQRDGSRCRKYKKICRQRLGSYIFEPYVYAMPIPSVCLSGTRVICVKTAERIIKILSPFDRPIILVFRHQGCLHKSGGFTPNGAPNTRGSNFRPICGYISETIIDRSIVTMEDEYKVVCALSNSAAFDDLEWPWTPISTSQYSLKANISQTVHPIHSMFGSRLWFSESADRMALFAVR